MKARQLKVIAAGHSHIVALQSGYHNIESSQLEMEFVELLDAEFRQSDGLDDIVKIQQKMIPSASKCDAVILSISGNEHQMLGLVRSERPFDFQLSDGPYTEIIESLEIVPFGLIYETIDTIMNRAMYDAFSGSFDCPVYLVEPPPPFLDESYIRTFAGVFAPKFEQHGVTEPSVRHKLWQVQCMIMRKRAKEAGFIYVANPDEAFGPEGFLHYLAYGSDLAHGNGWYGSLVINKIQSLISEGNC